MLSWSDNAHSVKILSKLLGDMVDEDHVTDSTTKPDIDTNISLATLKDI